MWTSSCGEAGPLGIPAPGKYQRRYWGSRHEAQEQTLRGQLSRFKIIYLLIFLQCRNCLQELYFVKRVFLAQPVWLSGGHCSMD